MKAENQKEDTEQSEKAYIPLPDRHSLNLGQLLKVEKEFIQSRRATKNENTELSEDSLGIALSGGGIRSATMCLGIVKELNKKNLMAKADYLSSVSGGGYLASYIHTALNKTNPLSYDELFDKEKVVKHLRDSRMHLLLFPNNKYLSGFLLLVVAVISFLLSWLWIAVPIGFFLASTLPLVPTILITIALAVIPAFALSPNFTSLHRYYKNRLREAYLFLDKKIKLKDLTAPNSPYPLINATVHVDKDDYDKTASVSYRGSINSNYFLFSPLYCGSQVTHYTRTAKSLYANFSLATAMATSAAAVNTFMGNMNLAAPLRWLMILGNLRTGLLAPSPLLQKNYPVFWPYYTILEVLGKAKTTSFKVQVSDGGHIENLAIYELLRRNVKTIIAVDGGQDDKFGFSDLRNLIIRARNELGVVIAFDADNDPTSTIKSSPISGASTNHFAIAKISGLKGSYAENYTGVLVYIKSSVILSDEFKIRELKRQVDKLKRNTPEFEEKRRELDHTMYRTYTPTFPHQTTADQFFSEVQWDAYYYLGKTIGKSLIDKIDIKKKDSRLDLHKKCLQFKLK